MMNPIQPMIGLYTNIRTSAGSPFSSPARGRPASPKYTLPSTLFDARVTTKGSSQADVDYTIQVQPTQAATTGRAAASQLSDSESQRQLPTPASVLGELRRISGLSWDQISEIFGVSRRSLHFWASGESLAPSNEQALHEVANAVRAVDRGYARENRTAILSSTAAGIGLQLLATGRYAEFVQALGRTDHAAQRPVRRQLNEAARALRAPAPPLRLLGAKHDPVAHDAGKLLRARRLSMPRELSQLPNGISNEKDDSGGSTI